MYTHNQQLNGSLQSKIIGTIFLFIAIFKFLLHETYANI